MRSRTVALLAALAIAVITSLAAPLAAPARADSGLTSPVLAGAGWTVAQLTDGTHASGVFGPDHGLTADVLLGLAATGAADATSRGTAAWLAAHAQVYIDGGYAGDVSAGAVAKLALVARSVGADPSSFGGLDLDAILLGRLQPSGRFTDTLTDSGPQPLDLSNMFTQALGVLALRQGTVAPASAVDFLAQQRCAAGGFPVFYPARPQDCLPDADGTGVAVQALLAVGRTADAAPAVSWLVAQQAADGSFRNGGPGAVPNTNSTALAAQALRDAGRVAEADAALAWLLTRQVGCSAPTADRGAIGYAEPVADASALRSTAQALSALAGVSLADSDDLVGSGPDQVPVPLCTATTSTTTTQTPTTTTTTTTAATTTTLAATTTAATSATSPTTPTTTGVAAALVRSAGGYGSSTTPPPVSPTPASTSPPSQPATPTTVVFGSDEASPPDPGSLSAAASDSTTPASGESGAPGIPWWIGAAAVLVAAVVWLGATGRLTRRGAA